MAYGTSATQACTTTTVQYTSTSKGVRVLLLTVKALAQFTVCQEKKSTVANQTAFWSIPLATGGTDFFPLQCLLLQVQFVAEIYRKMRTVVIFGHKSIAGALDR